MAQKQSFELLLTESGIHHRVTRRTDSKHPALQLFLDCLRDNLRRIALTSIVKLLTQSASTFYDTKQPAPLRHVLGFPQFGLLRELRHRSGSPA